MTAVAPNPPSPYADADARFRHLLAFPVLLPAPAPATLHPTACDRLAVVPVQPVETGADVDLTDGLCPICVAAMRTGAPLGDSRPATACRECGSPTRHDGVCALCRQDAHDTWWTARSGGGYETGHLR